MKRSLETSDVRQTKKSKSCKNTSSGGDDVLLVDERVEIIKRPICNVMKIEEFLFQGAINPLYIPWIVNEVFSYLTIEPLKACRLVNRQWDHEARKYVPAKSKVVFRQWKHVNKFVEQFHNVEENVTVDVPFVHYQFGSAGNTDDDNDEPVRKPVIEMEGKCAKRFFRKFGYKIHHLELHSTLNSWNELGSILFTRVPNLKELTLGKRVITEQDIPGSNRLFSPSMMDAANNLIVDMPRLPNLQKLNLNIIREKQSRSRQDLTPKYAFPVLEDIACVAPKLHTICCPSWPTFVYTYEYNNNDSQEDQVPLGSVFFIRPHTPLMNLTHLDMNIALNKSTIKLFTEQKYPLQSLKLTLECDVTHAQVDNLFQTFKNTITKLTFRSWHYIPNFTILKKLAELHVFSSRSKLFYKAIGDTLVQVPFLESLKLNRISLNKIVAELNKLKESSEEMFGLRTLEISEVGNHQNKISCSAKSITILAQRHSQLTTLKVDGLTDDALRSVFVGFPILAELTAENGHFTDAGVTGEIVTEEKEETKASGSKNKKAAMNNDENIKKEETTAKPKRQRRLKPIKYETKIPSLRDMKNLRKLEFNSPKLSDMCVLMEAVHCKNLKEIRLSS